MSAATLDSLATFETGREDLEEETDQDHDGREPDQDNEMDYLWCDPY